MAAFTSRAMRGRRRGGTSSATRSVMAQIRKILVPVDFSESARAALVYAVEVARKFGATIDLLHVWQAPTFIPTGSLPEAPTIDANLVDLVRKNAEEATARALAEAKKEG